MKTKKLILLGSVLLNVALAGVYFLRARAGSAPATPAALASANVPTLAEAWVQIDKTTAGDDAALVARLRAEGFPPEVVRAIITAQVSERFAARRRALEDQSGEYAYWRSYTSQRTANPESRSALRNLEREQTELLRQLLGDDARSTYTKLTKGSYYGTLSLDKIDQLEQINRDYADLSRELQSQTRGVLLPEDREKLAFLEKERRADLASLLTAEEIRQYELRSSDTANNLKARLHFFDASEQEYIALFGLKLAYDEGFNSGFALVPSLNTAADSKKRAEATKQLEKDIEAALGAERYAQYKVLTDYEYRYVVPFTERLGLPPDAAAKVVGLKQEISARATAVRAEKNLNSEQKQAQLALLADEAAAKITQQLGEPGFTAYQQSMGGWINSLKPRTTDKK